MTATRTIPTVSAVLIVKDEEEVLASSLRSVAWADQVVVYDTGSTDRTLEIARAHADTVVEGYWDEDFGAARNRAIGHATSEWVLVLDADEVFEGDPAVVRQRLGRDGATAHRLIVDNGAGSAASPFSGPDRVVQNASVRFFRRGLHRYVGRIHELPVWQGPGPDGGSTLLHGVVLRHTGYTRPEDEMRAKGERNLALAEAHLAAGLAEGAPPADLEWRRVQVVRSMVLSGRLREALAMGREMVEGGLVEPVRAAALARALVDPAEQLEGPEAADAWLRLWAEHDLNPAAARRYHARVAAQRDDPVAALEAIEAMPTTTINLLGERVDRLEVVAVEVWALARTGRARRAVQVARAAAERGVAPGPPAVLARALGEDRCRQVLDVVPDALWRELVTACLLDPVPAAREFLAWMHDCRPGDATVLAAAVHATPVLSLEEATRWSVAMRANGAAEYCPLVGIALDDDADPRQRALAGALAWSAYQDERGLAGLEAALALVPAEDEAELLGQLDVVAPGLVTPTVPA